MARLDHPLKRLGFVLSIVGALTFVALAVLPAPFEIIAIDWRDANSAESADRVVTRVDTECAGEFAGSTQTFASDYFVLESQSNRYAELLLRGSVERGEPITIAQYIDLQDYEVASYMAQLSVGRSICSTGLCIESLDRVMFEDILDTCGKAVDQVAIPEVHWYFQRNLDDHWPWPLIAALASVCLLVLSFFWDSTVGRVVTWIVRG